MTPELQDKLFKLVGALVVAAVGIACVKLIPDQHEMTVFIMSGISTAYGGVAWNSPIKAVQQAKGLVSVRAPSIEDAEKMKAAVAKVESMKPPAGGGT
jgi:hypothetical protein